MHPRDRAGSSLAGRRVQGARKKSREQSAIRNYLCKSSRQLAKTAQPGLLPPPCSLSSLLPSVSAQGDMRGGLGRPLPRKRQKPHWYLFKKHYSFVYDGAYIRRVDYFPSLSWSPCPPVPPRLGHTWTTHHTDIWLNGAHC